MSEEDKIQKFFRTYFTENKIKQDVAERIIKQAQQQDAKQRGREFLGRFFDALKKSYDSKNPKSFIPACKRFLFVINKLLGDIRKEKGGKYGEIISQQIVQYYLFFFEIIFKNNLLELTVDLKMYRMRWVKLITDSAFIKLRQEILKKYKFNLDRGFSEENKEKIKKIHQKRGLTQKQSNFYLGIETIQEQRKETKNVEKKEHYPNSSQSSSEQDNQNGHKKVKTDYGMEGSMNLMYSGYGVPSGYHPVVGTGSYENPSYPQYGDPRFNRPQSGYPPNYPSNTSASYLNKEIPREQTPRISPSGYPFPPGPSSSTSTAQSSYNPYQQYSRSYEMMKPSNDFKEIIEPRRSEINFQKIKMMRRQLEQNMFRCRECGQVFESGQNHDKHMTEHFFSSLQKVNQAELKGKLKRQGKMKLLDSKSWQLMQKSQEKEYRFEVLLSEVPEERNERRLCYFCNQELEISFSSKLEDWVYSDAVKIDDEGRMNIIHFNCYECFKSDQNSPEESLH